MKEKWNSTREYWRCAEGGQCSVGDVCRWSAQITAHVDARQDAGDGGEEDAKDAEPWISILILWPKILHEVSTYPAIETVFCYQIGALNIDRHLSDMTYRDPLQ